MHNFKLIIYGRNIYREEVLNNQFEVMRDTVGGDARLLAERALRQLQDLKG